MFFSANIDMSHNDEWIPSPQGWIDPPAGAEQIKYFGQVSWLRVFNLRDVMILQESEQQKTMSDEFLNKLCWLLMGVSAKKSQMIYD